MKPSLILLIKLCSLALACSVLKTANALSSLGDTVVVDASPKNIKHKNRMRSNGRYHFPDIQNDRVYWSTPFHGPANYQIQKVSMPMHCKCAEVDSFEVSMLYTNLTTCETKLIYRGWQILEGRKQLQITPQIPVTTDSAYLLSINLHPNQFPKNHPQNGWDACFYLKVGLVKSTVYYFFSDSAGLLLYAPEYLMPHPHKDEMPAPKMKLWLYR
jgi:hypothetical protein